MANNELKDRRLYAWAGDKKGQKPTLTVFAAKVDGHANRWIAYKDYRVEIYGEDLTTPIVGGIVRRGFVSDLVTIPRRLRWALNEQQLAKAAVVHDFILASANEMLRQKLIDPPAYKETRRVADDAFCLSVPWWSRWIVRKVLYKRSKKAIERNLERWIVKY